MKFWKHGIGAVALAGIVLVLTITPTVASATTAPGWFSCARSPVTCSIYYLTYLANTILGFFIAIAAWLMGFAFSLTLEVMKLPAVQIGFAFTLSFANLGFVLGIIVIAVATILRNQTYGIKKILGKLIVMAILINFSLTIAGTIINTSDNLSRLFLNQMAPGAVEGSSQTFAGVQGFVNAMTAAFAPNRLFNPPAEVNLQADLSAFVRSIFNMLFGIVFLGLMLIVYIAIDVILLIRSVYVALLIVLMPFAWISWVFPISQKNWTEWWDKFLKWVYFPPIALFFLYLAVLTVQMDSIRNCLGAPGASCDLSVVQESVGAQSSATAQTLERLVGTKSVADDGGLMGGIAQMIIVTGLAVGGLFAAQKVGAVGAGAAMGAATAAGQGFVNWGGQRVRRFPGGAARYFSTPKAPTRNRWYQNPLQGILAPRAVQESAAAAARRPGDIAGAAAVAATARTVSSDAERVAREKRAAAVEARQKVASAQKSGMQGTALVEIQRAAAEAERASVEADKDAAAKKSKAEELGKKEGELRRSGGGEEKQAPAPSGSAAAPAEPHAAPHHDEHAGGGAGAPAAPHEPAAPHAAAPAIAPVAPPGQQHEEKKEGPASVTRPRPIFERPIGEEIARPFKNVVGSLADNFRKDRADKGLLRSVGRALSPDGLRRWVHNYGYGTRTLGKQMRADAEAKAKGKPTGLLGLTLGAAAGTAWGSLQKEIGLKPTAKVKLTDKQMEALGHLFHEEHEKHEGGHGGGHTEGGDRGDTHGGATEHGGDAHGGGAHH